MDAHAGHVRAEMPGEMGGGRCPIGVVAVGMPDGGVMRIPLGGRAHDIHTTRHKRRTNASGHGQQEREMHRAPSL